MKKVRIKILRDKDRGYELLLFPIQLYLSDEVADTMEDGSKILRNCFKDYYDAKSKAEKLIKDPSRCLEDYYIIFDKGFKTLEYQNPGEFKLITKKKAMDYLRYEEFYQNIIRSNQGDKDIINSLIGNHDMYRISIEDMTIECDPGEIFSKGFYKYSQAYEIFVITQYRLLSDEEKCKNRYSKRV